MKKILLSLVMVVLAASLATGATSAYWNDTDSNTGNVLGTGTLDLALSQYTAFINYPSIYPGWHYTDASHWGSYFPGQPSDPTTEIRVLNSGSLPLKYRVKVVLADAPSDNALLDNLLVSLQFEDGLGNPRVELYNGTMRGLLDWVVVDTNYTTAPHSGWWGLGERILVENALPSTASDPTLQGKTVNFALQFDSTQTNNPGW